ncbi:hypothetical protein SODG_005457 [Sodalis praecaptivus]|nr:hypothetical protein NVIRENTERO_03031 [Sodalis praecaptivus]
MMTYTRARAKSTDELTMMKVFDSANGPRDQTTALQKETKVDYDEFIFPVAGCKRVWDEISWRRS